MNIRSKICRTLKAIQKRRQIALRQEGTDRYSRVQTAFRYNFASLAFADFPNSVMADEFRVAQSVYKKKLGRILVEAKDVEPAFSRRTHGLDTARNTG